MKWDKRRLEINKDTFVISDLHFGHRNITEFEPTRGNQTILDDCESQEDMLIARWNSVVKDDDAVVILGDYAFNNIIEYTGKLNGNKVLVRGNHDKRGDHAYYNAGFAYVYNCINRTYPDGTTWNMETNSSYQSAAIIDIDGITIALSHYPLDFYEDFYERENKLYINQRIEYISDAVLAQGATVNIHGHTHSHIVDDTDKLQYLNVSPEVLEFTPIKLGVLLEAAGIIGH